MKSLAIADYAVIAVFFAVMISVGVYYSRKSKSLTAQGRLQDIIVSALPLFLGIVITLIKPGLMIPFLTSGIGVLAILTACALITVGWLMIRKIIKIDV